MTLTRIGFDYLSVLDVCGHCWIWEMDLPPRCCARRFQHREPLRENIAIVEMFERPEAFTLDPNGFYVDSWSPSRDICCLPVGSL